MDRNKMIEDFNTEIASNFSLVKTGKISWAEFSRRQDDVQARIRAAGLFDAWVGVMLKMALADENVTSVRH